MKIDAVFGNHQFVSAIRHQDVCVVQVQFHIILPYYWKKDQNRCSRSILINLHVVSSVTMFLFAHIV